MVRLSALTAAVCVAIAADAFVVGVWNFLGTSLPPQRLEALALVGSAQSADICSGT